MDGPAKNENKGQLIDIIKRKLSTSVHFMWLYTLYCVLVVFVQQKHGFNVHVRSKNELNQAKPNQTKPNAK